jgi:hypothetical protein
MLIVVGFEGFEGFERCSNLFPWRIWPRLVREKHELLGAVVCQVPLLDMTLVSG